ncbi:MAG TPA: hypothetical protein VFN36_00340 [Solirubrobacteraceae bacterium]|nr:hypothetical protein [Solirubrobacteraceae bacterium]
MALTEPMAAPKARIARRSRFDRLFGGGTDGNEQLTAVTAVILLALFAVLGLTIVFIGQLLWLHLFLGVLLVGPVAVKMASTGYRFVRYYTSNPAYRRKGPPHPLMRFLGPFVVLSTVGVFLTGLVLLIDGPSAGSLVRFLHKATFIAWLGAVGIHVLWHLIELPHSLRAVQRAQRSDRGARGSSRYVPGSTGRSLLLLSSAVGGLVLAIAFLPQIDSWTAGLAHHVYHLQLH